MTHWTLARVSGERGSRLYAGLEQRHARKESPNSTQVPMNMEVQAMVMAAIAKSNCRQVVEAPWAIWLGEGGSCSEF